MIDENSVFTFSQMNRNILFLLMKTCSQKTLFYQKVKKCFFGNYNLAGLTIFHKKQVNLLDIIYLLLFIFFIHLIALHT